MFEPKFIIWLAGAVLGSLVLIKLMRARQAQLMRLLREYLQGKLAWAQKRAKAARMARDAAQEKARQEKETLELRPQPAMELATEQQQ